MVELDHGGGVCHHVREVFLVPGVGPATLTLTTDNLKTAVSQMLGYTDSEGDPIVAMPKYLMVGPGLMIQAMQILNSISLNHVVDTSGSDAGTAEAHGGRNVLGDLGIKLLVNPWIPVLATSANGATSWALFTDPMDIPAGEFGTLAGYDTPQVIVPDGAEQTTKRIQSDVLTWRVKHVFGGTTCDKRAGWIDAQPWHCVTCPRFAWRNAGQPTLRVTGPPPSSGPFSMSNGLRGCPV